MAKVLIPFNDLPSVFDQITITYYGEGDEGYINEITCYPEIEGVTLSDALCQDLEQIVYDILEQQAGGWEINEGSEGHVTIKVKEREVILHHGEHRVETDYTDTIIPSENRPEDW